MSDVWGRAAVVATGLMVAGAIGLWLRARSRRPRDVSRGRLSAGVYLFTSSTCPTCESARRRVVEVFGDGGFEELAWESHPDVFADTGVDVVPALVIVKGSGPGRLYPGASERALAHLDP
jgi:hypothetical protein